MHILLKKLIQPKQHRLISLTSDKKISVISDRKISIIAYEDITEKISKTIQGKNNAKSELSFTSTQKYCQKVTIMQMNKSLPL